MNSCRWLLVTLLLGGLLLSGCDRFDPEGLDHRLQVLRERPRGHVDALPEQPVYAPVDYVPAERRAPFSPWGQASTLPSNPDSGPRPDPQRSREPLEQFALGTLRFAGTFTINGRTLALMQTPAGDIVRLRVGEHLGEHNGQVVAINTDQLSIVELIPDGRGGFNREHQQLSLADATGTPSATTSATTTSATTTPP